MNNQKKLQLIYPFIVILLLINFSTQYDYNQNFCDHIGGNFKTFYSPEIEYLSNTSCDNDEWSVDFQKKETVTHTQTCQIEDNEFFNNDEIIFNLSERCDACKYSLDKNSGYLKDFTVTVNAFFDPSGAGADTFKLVGCTITANYQSTQPVEIKAYYNFIGGQKLEFILLILVILVAFFA
ncbi:hypothetical protein PPERSA_09627 [Pseudocohnilembus persalinus]|uniref:Transmembrane protein n=1 Tax=Pseudocohnilembus persalinus TaxID=266149 RepID=A0A0V0QFP3_PSEPJ|nr:hypothetical protein PPERSA_09627 [Pseudocohnilembus persalinus]|eukprot:KRX01021.1 hypothetical protein PPERSA_09627 [Pseudocohnilembus persalinus]